MALLTPVGRFTSPLITKKWGPGISPILIQSGQQAQLLIRLFVTSTPVLPIDGSLTPLCLTGQITPEEPLGEITDLGLTGNIREGGS
jgi:hypothetical protein